MSTPTLKRVDTIEISLARPCILIIDDDEALLERVRIFFSTRGYDVDTARTPEKAKQLLKTHGKDKYQLIASDVNFGDLSNIDGDQFIMENRSLFGKAKIMIITGGAWLTPERRSELRNAGIPFLEKTPALKETLAAITQKENQKWANDIEKIVRKEAAPSIEKITGRPVNIKVVAGAASAAAVAPAAYPVKDPLPALLLDRLKQTLITWLQTRSERDRPMLACGNETYSANQLIEEVRKESEVGIEHVRMLLGEFEYSLRVDKDDFQQDDEDEFEYSLGIDNNDSPQDDDDGNTEQSV